MLSEELLSALFFASQDISVNCLIPKNAIYDLTVIDTGG